ncbi:MAG: amino acid ABC transporter substrate-binding protein, partial [Chloroflexi bacterium]
METRSKAVNLFIILSILSILLVNCSGGQAAENTIVIAFAGNMDQAGSFGSQSEYAGVKMAVDEINALGGINGKTIALVPYNDDGDIATGQTVARQIVNSRAIAVLGHSTPDVSDAAGYIYDEGKMPAMNVVPGTGQLPRNHYYYYNSAFTAELQAIYLANYLRKVQGTSKVNIIF